MRIWCRDREIHISADIAYAVWSYWVACDDEWLRDYGAEIILETAIFWMSRLGWDNREERYEIRNVIGADEYHEYVSNSHESDGSVASGHSQYMTGFAKRSPTELPNWRRSCKLQSSDRAGKTLLIICGFPTISQPD